MYHCCYTLPRNNLDDLSMSQQQAYISIKGHWSISSKKCIEKISKSDGNLNSTLLSLCYNLIVIISQKRYISTLLNMNLKTQDSGLTFLRKILKVNKGQMKLKVDWRAVDSAKKRTNEFVLFAFLLFTANKTKQIHSFVFWENRRACGFQNLVWTPV